MGGGLAQRWYCIVSNIAQSLDLSLTVPQLHAAEYAPLCLNPSTLHCLWSALLLQFNCF